MTAPQSITIIVHLRPVDIHFAQVTADTTPIPILAPFVSDIHTNFVLYYGADLRLLTTPLRIFICPRSLMEDGPVNSAIQTLVHGSVPTPWPWCGPVLVMKHNSITDMNMYVDITDADILDVAAYFRMVY